MAHAVPVIPILDTWLAGHANGIACLIGTPHTQPPRASGR
jgi:hypothetical protein